MYVSDHNPKRLNHDELDDARRQLRQRVGDVVVLLQRFVQALGDDNQPLDRDDFASILSVLAALEQMTVPPQPPPLREHDMEAYFMRESYGWKQAVIARQLNDKYRTTYRQGQVSRMLDRAEAQVKAYGLSGAHQSAARARSVDPARLELGRRTDGRRTDGSRSKRRSNDE